MGRPTIVIKHPLVTLWLAAAAWPGLFGSGVTPGLLRLGEEHYPLIAIGAVLLALATVATWHSWLAAGRLTYAGIAAIFGASSWFCATLALTVWMASAKTELVQATLWLDCSTPGKLDFLCEAGPGKRWQLGARLVYRELGVCVSGRTAEGTISRFEPNDEDKNKRFRTLDAQLTGKDLRERLSKQIRIANYAAIIQLGALPLVAALYLLWLKLRARGSPV